MPEPQTRRESLNRLAISAAMGDVTPFFDEVLPVVTALCAASLAGDAVVPASQRACTAIIRAIVQRTGGFDSALHLTYEICTRTIDEIITNTVSAACFCAPPEGPGILTTRERNILTLRIVCGFTVEDVAASLRTNAHRVRIDQHLALSRLRPSRPAEGSSTHAHCQHDK